MSQIMQKYNSDRIGVGGSTGDADVGEQSQGSVPIKNPGESAAQIEQALFEKIGSGGQYTIMAKKLVEHIKKNQVPLEECEDIQALVSLVTNPRRGGKQPPAEGSSVNNNPFGGFQVK